VNDVRKIRLTLNGRAVEESVPANETLVEFLRYRLELTGTKEGCETGDCGACTVLVNGKAVNSCLILALEADGAEVTTVEGLGDVGQLHPLQQAFVDQGAVQCGFCTPGMMMAAKALLDEQPNPSEDDVRLALAGNLCRCTGYVDIMNAVVAAGKFMRASK
jgi:carbon-monoxide dehydrogenase small subunit